MGGLDIVARDKEGKVKKDVHVSRSIDEGRKVEEDTIKDEEEKIRIEEESDELEAEK